MRILVLSDSPEIAESIRHVVNRSGFESRPADIVPLSMAADYAARARRDLAVLVTSPDQAQTLVALRDLCALSAARVVAVGPTNDAKFLLQVLRDGAAEFVDEGEIEAELPRSLVRVKDRPQPAANGGAVIGVLGASGGSGTSTVAANLAVGLASRAQPRGVALCDLRLRAAGDLNLLLNLKPAYTLADLSVHCDRMDQNMVRQSLAAHASGVHLLAAAKAADQVASITPRGVRQAIALTRSLFPYVVLDLDRTFGPEQISAIVQTDLLLLVLRLDIMSLHNASRALVALEELGFGRDRVRLVVNRHRQRKELPASMVEQALGTRLAYFLPDDPATVNASINTGSPLLTVSPRAKISKGIAALADDMAQLRKSASTQPSHEPQGANLAITAAAAVL